MTRFLMLFLTGVAAFAEQRFQATGLVLSVDPQHQTVVISHDSIAGYMDAMVMPFHVRDAHQLENVHAATMVSFTLVVTKTSSYVSDLRLRPYESIERDPDQARRLKLLDSVIAAKPPVLEVGQPVPNFVLTDQHNRQTALSDFSGKVVALTFIYTRCPLPDYCYRLTNNFGRLQKRFKDRLGKDLMLVSITFDPEHDRPEVLAKYAEVWKADVAGWRFLTGPVDSVKSLCSRFGMNFWPDEGLLTHSLHTVLIDRQGKVAANLEGNQFTAGQLGDLVETALKK